MKKHNSNRLTVRWVTGLRIPSRCTGLTVPCFDINKEALDRAILTITNNLDRLVKKGAIDEALKTETLGRISTSTDLQSAVANADLVVEAATENREIKLNLFKQLSDSL